MGSKGISMAVMAVVLVATLTSLTSSGRALGGELPDPAQAVDVFVNLTTDNLEFMPDQFRVPPNATVHVRITQGENVPHTFTVGTEKDVELPTSWTPSQLNSYFAQGNNLTDIAIPDLEDTVVWANFTAPSEQGRYEFVCRVAGHFQAGMLGFMIVELREVFVNMTTQGMRFVPDRFTAPPGAQVHVRITQGENVPHTFTVGTEKDVELQNPSSWTPAELNAYFVDKNLTDVAIPDLEDTVVWANFTAPREPGRYEFVCRVGGHFQSGMFGFMIVSEEPPPPEPGGMIGLIAGIMVLTIGFVLVFAAVYHVRSVRAAKRKQ